jgi:hypothetical protein
LALTAVIGLLVTPARSQTFYGSMVGIVNDASGSAVPDTTVSLTNNGTGERRAASSGSDGGYRFVNLVPGNYRLEIERPGFRRYVRDQIVVNVEAAVRIDVTMEVGDVTQSVEVTGETPLIQTENASLSQVVSARSVQEIPLNGRNVLNLINLVPGVVPQGSSDGNLTGKNVFAAGNYQVGGGTANQSATLFDGVTVNDTYGNIVAFVPSPDAVSEFRVQTNNNSAEYGRYTGGVINIASKSGSNEFHGSLYEYLRNRSVNATDFFANATGAGKPAFTQNQFGGAVGGPIRKDKTFFFANYEGFRLRQGRLFTNTVPTAAMLSGDFSDYRTTAGAVVPIYDPLTNCGQLNNAPCGSGTVQRTVFPSNMIPQDRINPVAKKFVTFPNFALPNVPGQPFTHNNNFSKILADGGENNQLNFRGDQNVSDKQRLLARFSRWHSWNMPIDIYGNGVITGGPEDFVTTQAVLADTYSLSPTTIFDIRASFMRWFYARTPGHLGIKLTSLGLPSYFDQLPNLDGVDPVTTLPQFSMSNPTYNSIGTGLIYARDNSYVLVPSLTKIHGRHTLKFGAELRRQDINYYQANQTGGNFTFDNLFTSQNALSPGTSGNSFASFLLGYAASGTVQTSPFTAGGMRYQGYYANDTFQATSKLTLTLGLRWEIPGVYTERFDRLVTFDPTAVNPVLQGILVNGAPVKGAFALVNSSTHPERGMRPEHYTLFAPRVGVAYRLNSSTVIRTGGGLFFPPANVQFPEGPYGNPVNYFNNIMVSSINSNVTPLNTMSDPYPNGLTGPPARNPAFQKLLLGGSARTPLEHARYPYVGQWNFTIQRELKGAIALEASYSGLRGLHLPQGALQLDQLSPQYFSLGSQLQQQVTNPFYGLIANGVLSQPTVQRGQLLLPFPEYTSVPDVGGYVGASSYHSLQTKMEKRFHSGGTVLVAYTFSKNLTNAETLTTWLDTVAGVQDFTNMSAEKSLSSFDSRQRLTVGYVADLPFGKGQRFLPDAKGVAGALISGWGIDGVSTFQKGFPLGFTATPNLTGFNTGLRPNVIAGCDKTVDGPAQSRLNHWFNTSCFTVPGAFTFGSESRTDPVIRGPGVNNFDLSLFKKTQMTERLGLEFRTEFYNLFNRVQFGSPNLVATTAANSTFGGNITRQANTPRVLQFALRLRF